VNGWLGRRTSILQLPRDRRELIESRLEIVGDLLSEDVGLRKVCRIFVDKSVWSQVLVGLNEEMDYDNFKSEVARHQGSEGAAYEHSLHEVWSVMNKLQK